MKLAIIADDLTGANDSGVQLAKYGLNTKVFFDLDKESLQESEAIVFDTDSRSINKEEAYQKVKEVTEFLIQQGVRNIFKKIDSTMRGNIGTEINALFDVIQPDFMFIAPGYPQNGRSVKDGHHYLNGILLNQTEIARDPKTPVTESFLPKLIKEQTQREVGLISKSDFSKGFETFQRQLHEFKEKGISYILLDSEAEEDLSLILDLAKKTNQLITWVGSAGIANVLPSYFGIDKKESDYQMKPVHTPVLTVVGSVNVNSRKQLKKLLERNDVVGIKVESYKAVTSEEERKKEMSKVYRLVKACMGENKHVAIYSSGEQEDIQKARKVGEENGFNHTEVSNEIVKMLGSICSVLLEEGYFKGISMTGGDTAKQVCELWDIKGFRLLGELEVGVPISTFIGLNDIYVVTKAGGFGTEDVFIHAIEKLKGED